jgi:hypothetical protein
MSMSRRRRHAGLKIKPEEIMNALELKELVRQKGSVTIIVVAGADNRVVTDEVDISDMGASMAGDSTYLEAGMKADIVDACLMPALPDMIDAREYNANIKPGLIYFVFRHDIHAAHNEPFAGRNWQSNEKDPKQRKYGTAIEVGCYTGFDVVGFDSNFDMQRVLVVPEE